MNIGDNVCFLIGIKSSHTGRPQGHACIVSGKVSEIDECRSGTQKYRIAVSRLSGTLPSVIEENVWVSALEYRRSRAEPWQHTANVTTPFALMEQRAKEARRDSAIWRRRARRK